MNNLLKRFRLKAITPCLMLFISLPLLAAEVTSNFNDGDTLTAEKMNEIKGAVNSKQNAVTGTCPAGESIRTINDDGSVTCEAMPISGVEGMSSNNSSNITSTTAVSLATLTIAETGTFDVALNAHATIEISGSTSSRLRLQIRQDSCTGALLGQAMWRPGASSGTYLADTVSLTGFQADASGPATYVFCGEKFDSGFPNAYVFFRGFNLSYSN